jgi:hypothetical protein
MVMVSLSSLPLKLVLALLLGVPLLFPSTNHKTTAPHSHGCSFYSDAASTETTVEESCTATSDDGDGVCGGSSANSGSGDKNQEPDASSNHLVGKVQDFSEWDCEDISIHCSYWAENGECGTNKPYMSKNCRRSCQLCPDQQALLEEKLDLRVGADIGELQDLENAGAFYIDEALILARIVESREYLKRFPKSLECKNQHKDCTRWALVGECDKNPSYSKIVIPLVC